MSSKKNDAFDAAFRKFEGAHKSVLDLDKKKLLPSKAAGEALKEMRTLKGWKIDSLIAHLSVKRGIVISRSTHDRYVKVASRWKDIVALGQASQEGRDRVIPRLSTRRIP